MQLPRSSQNLYTAHEVAQVKPLFDRENTYQTFMMTNHWVTAYLPNAFEHLYPLAAIDKRKKSRFVTAFRYVVTFFNVLARYVQLWYMTDKANSEIISDTVLAFYTGTTQKKVLAEYEKRLQDEGL